MSYVLGKPLNLRDLTAFPLEKFTTIIILCDRGWLDPDVYAANGIDARDPEDILRLDAMLLMVHINVRMLLKSRNAQNVRIISEKVPLHTVVCTSVLCPVSCCLAICF